MPKYGQYTEETAPSDDDLVVIKENASGANRRVKLQNILPAGSVTTAKIADGSVTSAKLSWSTMPWGACYFTTFGSSGGQVISTGAQTPITFNDLDAASVGVTMPSNGQLQVTSAGVYWVSCVTRTSDAASTGNGLSLYYSTNGGSTWTQFGTYTPLVNLSVTEGLRNFNQIVLPASARVRAEYFSGGGATRIAASDSAGKYQCSLSLHRVA